MPGDARAGLAQPAPQLGQPVAAILALRLRACRGARSDLRWRRSAPRLLVPLRDACSGGAAAASLALRRRQRRRGGGGDVGDAGAGGGSLHRRFGGFLPKKSSPTSAFGASCRSAAVAAASSSRSRRGVSAAGGFFRKKLNMERRPAGKVEVPQRRQGSGRWEATAGPKPVVILVGSGALAQSVRATES